MFKFTYSRWKKSNKIHKCGRSIEKFSFQGRNVSVVPIHRYIPDCKVASAYRNPGTGNGLVLGPEATGELFPEPLNSNLPNAGTAIYTAKDLGK
jgi:hypothetical protein